MSQLQPRLRHERNEQTAKEYFLEQCAAYFDDLKAAAKNAPHGQVLNVVEAAVIEQGQELLRKALETLVQDEIDEIEKKKNRGTARNAKRKNGISATERKHSSPPGDQ